jgi:hypothetical protein
MTDLNEASDGKLGRLWADGQARAYSRVGGEMIIRPAALVLAAAALIIVGFVQLMQGSSYADAAKREASTVGTITSVSCGRSCVYFYVFTVNDVRIADESSTCKTPLSSERCKKGAPVRVYYDPNDLSVSLLEELGAGGRGRLFMGAWMVSCGLVILGWRFVASKMRRGSQKSGGEDDESSSDEPDAIHIVPGE